MTTRHGDTWSVDSSDGNAPRDEPVVDPAPEPDARWDPPADPKHDDPGYDDPDDDDLFVDAFQPPKRRSRLTVFLVVALLVVAGFTGGVLVQKHHDVALAAAAAGVPRRGGGGQGGGQGGGRAGASSTAAAGSGGFGGGGRGAGDGSAAAGDAGTPAPVVTGTIRTVDDNAIEVTDPAGAVVRVFVSGTTTVTTLGLGGLKFGTPVAVAGTKDVDGSVTATSVTVRPPGG